MGKFAPHGLAHSMARELAPKNIYPAHLVADGADLPEHHSRRMAADVERKAVTGRREAY